MVDERLRTRDRTLDLSVSQAREIDIAQSRDLYSTSVPSIGSN